MKASTTATTIASIAACVFAGVLLLQCGPTDPINAAPLANGGNARRRRHRHVADAGAGGNSAAGNGSGGTHFHSVPRHQPAAARNRLALSTHRSPRPRSNCGVQTQNPAPQPVDLLLVLDRSGSMADDIATDNPCTGGPGGGPDAAPCSPKWPTMTASLNQVLASSPAGVQWGLKFFSSPKKPSLHGGPRSRRGGGAKHRGQDPDRDGQHLPGKQHSDHGCH